ncbi:MAG: hypothetical protein LUI87_12240 [Lachnospiraceae bacterium]|nr:hypothetical protein [Lachnospiraceae bacterium]
MKLVKIDTVLLEKYKDDSEILVKDSRPCVLVVRLKYKDRIQDFAVPLRSNIPASADKSQFYPLPPRSSTKPGNRHGLHYIKMFPVSSKYLIRYRTEGNAYATLICGILDKHERQIVRERQRYLKAYENGERLPYSTDIDYLLTQLDRAE